MKKVSIIIPVYNIEKYLKQCIESILNQTYKNIEIILVNDGSTDNSKVVCEFYKEESKIILYDQENQGVSCARNKGLELASGEYILFVDGDDYIEYNMVEKMVDAIDNFDMAVCGYVDKYVKKDFKHMISSKKISISSEDMTRNLFDNDKSGGYIFNKIFKASIIKENDLKFNEKIYMCEDLLFVIRYLYYCNEITLLPDILYNYRMRKSSAVWNKNEKYLTIFNSYDLIKHELVKRNIEIDIVTYNSLFSFFLLNKKQKKLIEATYNITFIKDYNKIMSNKKIRKNKKIKLFIVKNFKFIYYMYLKQKVDKSVRYE